MAISTMYPAKAGSPKTELTADLAAAATSMTVADASALPPAPNLAVLGDDSSAEVVSYTAISGNVVSGLIRGLGGTTASLWPSGTDVARNYTSFDHDRFIENIENLESTKISGVAWGDVTGSIEDQTDLSDILDEKAPLANPTFTGIPNAPTAATGVDTTQIATCAFVHRNGVYHGSGIISAGSATTFSNSSISSDMVLIYSVYGNPANVLSHVTVTTGSGTITFSGTFSAATTVAFDLVVPTQLSLI
jgi:hypothetical protein